MPLSPYYEKVAEAITAINQKLAELLELTPGFTIGDDFPGIAMGLNMTRSIQYPNDQVIGGVQVLTLIFDVLYQTIISHEQTAQIAGKVAGAFLDLDEAIAQTGVQVCIPGAKLRDMRPSGRFDAIQSQQSNPPHDWNIVITGQISINLLMYRENNGVQKFISPS